MYETVVDLLKNRNCIDAAFPNWWESTPRQAPWNNSLTRCFFDRKRFIEDASCDMPASAFWPLTKRRICFTIYSAEIPEEPGHPAEVVFGDCSVTGNMAEKTAVA